MKLKYIKLAGFKSFADQTILEFPDKVTAIIGPNGCGKSNIVDAIRWVMGETAHHIRGETLDDVVFQGTGSRKPQGLASVELVFDNTDGTLEGRFAAYTEVSIRRTTTRERDSKYYLNGTRCRRKDITELLQGTGLTGNKYSIIEQGMMSGIVDAKPEEMRGYVEEAAGVAHYKERRRDAELNMRRTQENLDRVLDIRDEVAKQLSKTKTQAKSAEHFIQLKSEKKQQETAINFLKKRALTKNIQTHESQLSEMRIEQEKTQAGVVGAEARIKEINQKALDGGVRLDKVKETIYALNAEIISIENTMKARNESEAQLRTEQKQIHESLKEMQESLDTWKAKRSGLIEKRAQLADTLKETEAKVAEIKEQLDTRSEESEELTNLLQARDRETRGANESIEVERAKISLLNDELKRLTTERDELLEHKKPTDEKLQTARREREDALKECMEAVEKVSTELKQVDAALERTTSEAKSAEDALQAARTREHELKGRLESLRAMQEDALNRNDADLRAWLSDNKLTMEKQLAVDMKVDTRWEKASEVVLGSFLDAIIVKSLDNYSKSYEKFEGGVLTLIEQSGAQNAKDNTLGSKMTACDGLDGVLGKVKLADSLADALARRDKLQDDETFVTPSGEHVGRHWIRIYKPKPGQEGVLARRGEIESTQRELDKQQAQNKEVAEQLNKMRQDMAAKNTQRTGLYHELATLREKAAGLKAEMQHFEKLLRHEQETREKFEQGLERVEIRIAEISKELSQCESAQTQAHTQSTEISERYGDLESKRSHHTAQMKVDNERLNEAFDKLRSLEVDSETARVGSESATEHVARIEQNIKDLHTREEVIEDKLKHATTQPNVKNQELEDLLARKTKLEDERRGAEAEAKRAQEELKALEGKRDEAQKAVNAAREKQSAISVDLRVAKAQEDELTELLKDEIEPQLAEDVTIEDKTAELAATQKRIDKLGTINLAAVEEYKELSERKNYLDSQNDDLVSAMDSLKKSIKKINEESERRFNETLKKINEHLSIVFPQLFGGGNAQLKMTGDDALKDGVAVVASPPGKRTVSINMLSGGEKALIAAAILLSIFELRPAPFCVLDEVDAPLDDRNVDRFCALLRKMSERVQLILITHNKISMEYADTMVGVTMREAGVTRPVSVNIDEAVKMAAV